MPNRIEARLFWAGAPLLVAAILFWPEHHRIVVHVHDAPFAIELNPLRWPWPSPLGEMASFFPATALSLVLLAGVLVRRRGAPRLAPARATAFFLPTYLAGIESVNYLAWSLRCHSTTPMDAEQLLRDALTLSLAVLALTIAAGCAAARLRCPGPLRVLVPGAVVAIVTSVGLVGTFLLSAFF